MPSDRNFFYRLILADGTVLENCECGYYEKSLWCFLKGIPFAEAFQYFSSPEKFGTVIFDIVYTMGYTDRTKYEGFTKITSVVQKEFTVDIRLEGEQINITNSRIDNDTEVGEA